MKKIVLLMTFAVGMMAVNAQAKFGTKIGVNLASLHGDIENSDMALKMYFGGYATFAITDKFQVQPELLYQGLGAKQKYERTDFGVTSKFENTYQFSYLTVPVMLKYYFAEGFYGEFGPQFGFALSQKVKYKNDTNLGVQEGTKDVENAQSFDIAAGFGLGYELEGGINFGARYNLGLNSAIETDNEKVKNGAIMIGLGYTFGNN